MGKSLADVLATVQQPGPPTTLPTQNNGDMFAMLMAMMQENTRAAENRATLEREARKDEETRRREDKAESNKMLMTLAGLIVPSLLNKPAIDPLVMKMLESTSNKDQMQQFMAAQTQLTQQSGQMFMQNVTQMVAGMNEMQTAMQQRAMDAMEERMARIGGGDDEDNSPWADIVKAVLPAIMGPKAATIGTAVVGAVAAQSGNGSGNGNGGGGVPALVHGAAGAGALIPGEVKRKIRIMQLAMVLHQRGAGFTEEKRGQFRASLVGAVARANDVAHAVMTDNQAGLITALTPAVEVDKPLGTWLAAPGVFAFVSELVATVIKPGLMALAVEINRLQEAKAQAQVQPGVLEEIPMRSATIMQHDNEKASPSVKTPVIEEPEVLGPATLKAVGG